MEFAKETKADIGWFLLYTLFFGFSISLELYIVTVITGVFMLFFWVRSILYFLNKELGVFR